MAVQYEGYHLLTMQFIIPFLSSLSIPLLGMFP
jgi:hypothetical protein